MKRLLFCCCLLADMLFCSAPSFAQCTPDPNCTSAQLLCPPVLSPGCEGDSYAQTITISLGGTLAGFPLTNLTVSNLTGLPAGLSFSCTPPSCVFTANSSGCILVSGTPTVPGTYPIRANLLVNIGFVVPIDTAVGSITIQAKDCAGICGGTASLDNCGICSGGNTGVLPNCDDANACTVDACDGSGGCLYNAVVCDDNNVCTTDTCDNGQCVFDSIAGCGGNPCDLSLLALSFSTQNACVGDTAVLTNTSTGIDPAGTYYIDQNSDGVIDVTFPVGAFPVGASQSILAGTSAITIIAENPDGCRDTAIVSLDVSCSDNDLCTADACSNATCSFPPLNCDDGDTCTADICDNGTCVNTQITGCGLDPCLSSLLTLDFDFQDVCEGDTATITNNSTGVDAAGVYFIDQGSDGSIDMTFQASVFPPGVTQTVAIPGDVNLTIIAQNPDGCTDTFTINIQAIVCDDNDACTTDNCVNTICSSTPLICDDGDTCTTDVCDNGICVYSPIAGCNSGNPCITNGPLLSFAVQDACLGDTTPITNNSTGIDPAGTYLIDQNSDGTIDITIPASAFPVGTSQNLPVPGNLNITIIVENPDGCRDTAVVAVQAIVCDDGDLCTTDACSNGVCIFTPSCCVSNADCNDGDACTTDSCSAGQCLNAALNCNDGNDCTTDACDNGQCTNTAIVCDDTLACTTDSCVLGSCRFTPLNCDDGDTCTTDACNNGVCIHMNTCCASNADCNDNDGCTIDSCAGGTCLNTIIDCDDNYGCTQDFCVNGACAHLAICCVSDTDCNDADACTTDDCVNGTCSRTPNNCDDNDACTTDACLLGNCQNTLLNCDDGDSCTTDLCNNGVCLHSAGCCITNADCNDSDACTTDSCGGGLCMNAPLNCDDGDSCTTDLCDNGVCVNQSACCTNDSDCYDGDLCTTNECVNGLCVNQPKCDDADACTDDHCSYYNGGQWNHGCHGGHNGSNYYGHGHSSGHHGSHGLVCYHTTIDCRDGDRCTTDDCVNGQCVNTPINCDDGDSCTTDLCVLGICKHTKTCCTTNSDCSDYDPCTMDTCSAGLCVITPMNCDDGDVCTDDACNRGWNHYNNGWNSHNGGHDDDDDGWHDDDDDNGPGGSQIGTCVHHPVNCRDGNVCTSDYCDSTGCVNDTIAGCCTADSTCDDSDVCTVDRCKQNSCKYFPAAGIVRIEVLGDWCQDGGVVLKARAPSGSTFAWSTGDSTQTIRGFADSTYTVTITDANGCQSIASFTVGTAEDLLSSYVIIADERVRLSGNTVFSGGVGARDFSGDIYLKNATTVTAAGTFVRADGIYVSSSSAATTRIATRANVTLPAYENNPYPGGMDVNVTAGTTATLNGSVFDDVNIGANSVITFTQTDLYFDNIYLRDNVTLKFAPCTKVHIKDKLRLGSGNIFNPDGNDVIVYVDDVVEINSGSMVTADIYVRDGSIFVSASAASAPTVMKGLFIAERVEAQANTHWYVNANCGSCGNLQPLIVSQKTDAVETSEGTAIADALYKGAETALKAYPNPFSEVLNIEFAVVSDTRVKLEIFNLGGQQIATVFEGFVSGGETRKVEFKPASNAYGMVIYRLQTEQGSFFGKAIMTQ